MKQWKTVDKRDWPRGPWDAEPDKAQWIDESTNLDCLIVRGPLSALCGYVGIPANHKLYEVDYMKIENGFEVHGGLTFSSKCHEDQNESEGICHIKEIAANKKVWWFGFDCAHAFDLEPNNGFMSNFRNGVYRDFAYVKSEVENLARQLKEVK